MQFERIIHLMLDNPEKINVATTKEQMLIKPKLHILGEIKSQCTYNFEWTQSFISLEIEFDLCNFDRNY